MMFIVMAISYIILQNNQAKTADLLQMTERHKLLTTKMFFLYNKCEKKLFMLMKKIIMFVLLSVTSIVFSALAETKITRK